MVQASLHGTFKLTSLAAISTTLHMMLLKYLTEIDMLLISVRNYAKCVLGVVQDTDKYC